MKKFFQDLKFNPEQKIVVSDKILLDKRKYPQTKLNFKPNGFWYGCGKAWIDWCLSEDFHLGNYIYELKLKKNILNIKNFQELISFDEEYKKPILENKDYSSYTIDWNKVALKYDGLEINPYIYKARFSHVWYYGWDCASGCIWNTSIIEEIKLIGENYECRV